jgi:Asp-tRNA(Asn)/Glu-tRNA(Gln) amidotransferase A subunit family amidase
MLAKLVTAREKQGQGVRSSLAQDRLLELSATAAAAEIARGALSAEQYCAACLDHIERRDGEIKAFVHLDRDHALSQARALDRQRADGHAIGPLHGIPVGIKDIIDTADYPAEMGSPLAAGRKPARDATVVTKLRAAGAVIIGKTVTTEFAYYHPGPTCNPHDLACTPGGSSSGSAAAVAAHMVPLALGSQTNGSIIRPASFCGVFAIKPSHGLVSRAGVLMLSRKLDHVGAFARSLDDLALILDVMAGPDQADPDTHEIKVVERGAPPRPPRFAFVRTPVWQKANAETQAAFDRLVKTMGSRVTSVDLSEKIAKAWNTHRLIMATDMAHNLAPFLTRGEPSDALSKIIAEGRAARAVDYLSALRQADHYRDAVTEILESYDAILTPAAAGVAPRGLHSTGDPVFCSLWTLTGLPALCLPLLTGGNGLPIGVQLVGPAGQDARLLRAATALIDMLPEMQPRQSAYRAGF